MLQYLLQLCRHVIIPALLVLRHASTAATNTVTLLYTKKKIFRNFITRCRKLFSKSGLRFMKK